MRRRTNKETGLKEIVLTRSEMSIKLEEYFIREYGTGAAAARYMKMKPQQLNDIFNCRVMPTEKVLSHYSRAKREITKVDNYILPG